MKVARCVVGYAGVVLVLVFVAGCFGGDDGGDDGKSDTNGITDKEITTQPDAASTLCAAGEVACDKDGDVVVCSADGNEWTVIEVCPAGCNLGECVVEPDETCTPGETQCNAAGDVEKCNAAGDGWDVAEICPEGCNLGACVVTDPLTSIIWLCGCDITCDGETVEAEEPDAFCMPDGDEDEASLAFAEGCYEGVLEVGCSEDESGCLCLCVKTEDACEE